MQGSTNDLEGFTAITRFIYVGIDVFYCVFKENIINGDDYKSVTYRDWAVD